MMRVFKEDTETKRVIFNVRIDLAKRLEKAKSDSRRIGRKLNADSAVDSALEKFLKKAEKKISEIKKKQGLVLLPDTENETEESESLADPGIQQNNPRFPVFRK